MNVVYFLLCIIVVRNLFNFNSEFNLVKPEMASPRGRRPVNTLNSDKNCYHNLVSPLESGTYVHKQRKMNCKGPSISDAMQEN